MDDRELVSSFEECTLDPDLFDHRAHVRLAWLFLTEAPLLEALPRYSNGIRRYAGSLGAGGKYHETITWAFVFLIHERMQVSPAEATFEEFAAANADLFAWKPLMARYYSEERLGSEVARATFVLPDAAT